jgi:hypothetical protein
MRSNQQLKGALMETVKHERTGKSAEVRFDKKRGSFFCIIGEDHFVADNIRAVRQWAQARVKLSDAIDWIGVLEVTAPEEGEKSRRFGRRSRDDEDSTITTEMQFSAERYYIGRSAMGKWYTTTWASRDPDSQHHLADDEVIAQARDFGIATQYEDPNHYENRNRASGLKMPKFKLPHRAYNTHYLPYDEDAWAGLQVIAENVAASRITLRKLLIDKKVIESLQQIAAGTKPLLLGSGGSK